jgi:hypothetical protein
MPREIYRPPSAHGIGNLKTDTALAPADGQNERRICETEIQMRILQ